MWRLEGRLGPDGESRGQFKEQFRASYVSRRRNNPRLDRLFLLYLSRYSWQFFPLSPASAWLTKNRKARYRGIKEKLQGTVSCAVGGRQKKAATISTSWWCIPNSGESLLRCLVCRDRGFLEIPFTDSNSMALFWKWMIPMKSYKSILLPPTSPFLCHAIALRLENFRIYVQTKAKMNNSILCQKSEPRHQKIPCDLKRQGAWFSTHLPPRTRRCLALLRQHSRNKLLLFGTGNYSHSIQARGETKSKFFHEAPCSSSWVFSAAFSLCKRKWMSEWAKVLQRWRVEEPIIAGRPASWD